MTKARFMKRATTIALGAAVATFAGVAGAATDTANLQVSAVVQTACAIGAGTLDFGNVKLGVTAGAGTLGTTGNVDADSGSSVKVVCTNGSSAAITADNGANDASGRNMASGTDRLKYELYTTTGRGTVLDASTNSIPVTGDGTSNAVTIFGRIFGTSLAMAPAGSYSDTVALTVTYTP